ncbi:MAG: nucleotide exchange factor GrpE [Chloroflexi bacterium]|nr:nucleotide exchange factor GrpE [Chloroflexota bacterium]
MAEEEQTGKPEAEVAGVEKGKEEDIEALKQALAEEKAKAETNLAGWQRSQADFINYRRRAEQEKEETGKFANCELVKALLPILDDMDRAFASLPPELAEVKWVDGIRLIERKLRATLEAQGLTGIKAVGEPFDPRLHEAVLEVEGKEGIVIQELQKGYSFRDRVARPAKVAVGNGKAEKAGEKKEA